MAGQVVDLKLRREMHLAKVSKLPNQSEQALREVALIEAIDKLEWTIAKKRGTRKCEECNCKLNFNERYLCIPCFREEDGSHDAI
ncbi:MAG: hypothetical protein V3U75_13450 [Methylococcaceae bacterium]